MRRALCRCASSYTNPATSSRATIADQSALSGAGERRLERITGAAIEGAYRRMSQLGNAFGLLVVEEAHHFGGEESSRMEARTWPCQIPPGDDARCGHWSVGLARMPREASIRAIRPA